MKKISVIIPVYNGERYIQRCIDSVLSQVDFRVHDFDILLMNDGSKDGSLKILHEYQAKYPGVIRVIDHENIGVAKTRNKAIKLAQGEYVIFIDQDDWIDVDYCNVLYEAISTSKLDIVSAGYRRPDEYGNIRQKSLPKNTQYGKYIVMAAWAKIHRTDFLRKKNVSFFDNRFGEDAVFTVKEISSTEKWQQIEYIGYNWFYNESSVSNTSQQGLKFEDRAPLLRLLQVLSGISGPANTELFQYFMLRTIVGYLMFSGRNATKENFLQAYEEMFAYVEAEFPELYKNKYLPFGPRGEAPVARTAIAMVIFLRKTRLMKTFVRIYCKQ